MRWSSLALVLPFMPMLASCTTLTTGITSSPPGIHKDSFRECLLENRFFSPTALVGDALTDYNRRHQSDTGHSPDRDRIMKMSGAEFSLLTTKIIGADLLPHQQFGGGASAKELREPSLARPYGQNLATNERYPDSGYPDSVPPQPGSGPMPQSAVNRYLDCYIGPVGHEPASDANNPGLLASNDGDDDIEGRLLRAHILLALTASYGAELLSSRPAANLATRAEQLLTHVRAAEAAIRSASPVMNPAQRDLPMGKVDAKAETITVPAEPTTEAQPVLRWRANVVRILRVFQVAGDVEMIDAQQSLDRAKNLIAAFNQPSNLVFMGILKDAVKGLGTVMKVRLMGDGMLRDARETLAVHRRTTLGAIGGDFTYSFADSNGQGSYLWKLWDGELARACTVIASAAKQEDVQCVPDEAAMAKLVEPSGKAAGAK